MIYNPLLKYNIEAGITLSTPAFLGSLTTVGSGQLISQNNLVWNQSLNRLGVGTNNPQSNLHLLSSNSTSFDIESTGVNGRRFTVFSTDSTASIGGGWYSIYDNTGSTHFITGNSTEVRIRVPLIINYNNCTINLNSSGVGGRNYQLISTNNTSSAGGGKFLINDQTGSSARLTIDSSGNTGIGTTSPSSRLDVIGDIEIGITNYYYFGDPNTNNSVRMGISGTNFIIQVRQGGTWVTKQTFSIA
jgi:hypothetical protein